MIRREFVRRTLVTALGAAGAGAAGFTPLRGTAGAGDWSADMAPDAGLAAAAAAADGATLAAEFPKAPGLTKYVAEFIVNTKYQDIPGDVLDLGKKSILDGFGLALAGSASTMAPLVRRYVQGLGLGDTKSGTIIARLQVEPRTRGAGIIGTSMNVPARFAAFANGVAIHSDDFDDTQLAWRGTASTACSLIPRSPRFRLRSRWESSVNVRARSSCWPITWAWRPNAKSLRPSTRAITMTASTPPARSARSAARQLRPPRGLNATQTAYALGIAAAEGSGSATTSAR